MVGTIAKGGTYMFRTIQSFLFPTAEQRQFAAMLKVPLPTSPPPLPPAKSGYVLRRNVAPEVLDVYDGSFEVGTIERVDGDEEHDTYWQVSVPGAHFDYFRSLAAAKEWLGNPPVRRRLT